MPSNTPPDTYPQLLFGVQGTAVWALCLGVGLHALNWYIVSTTAPTMVADLGQVHLIAWISLIYLTASVISGVCAGQIKRRLGARAAMVVFASVFAAGSLIVALAPTMGTVLLGRAVQGAGEGVVLALAYAAVTDLFSNRATPKLFGLFAVVYAVSAAVGPLLAGLITEALSWRVAYAVNLLLVGTYIALVLRAVPQQRPQFDPAKGQVPALRLALIGSALVMLGLTALLESVVLVVGLIALAGGLLALCLQKDRAAATRLFPRGAFGFISRIGRGFWVLFTLPCALAGISVFLPLYSQYVFGLSITAAGYMAILITVAWSASALGVGAVRSTGREPGFILLGAVGQFLGAALVLVGVGLGTVWGLIGGLVLIGGGLGTCWAFVTQQIIALTPARDQDLAAAQVPVVQTIAAAVGAGLVGAVASLNGLTAQIPAAGVLQTALLPVFSLGLVLALIGLVFALGFVRPERQDSAR